MKQIGERQERIYEITRRFAMHKSTKEWFRVVAHEMFEVNGKTKIKYFFDNGDWDFEYKEYYPMHVEIHPTDTYDKIFQKYPDTYPRIRGAGLSSAVSNNILDEIMYLEDKINDLKELQRRMKVSYRKD